MPRQKLPKAYSTKITPRKTPAVVFEKIYAWLYKMSVENDLEAARNHSKCFDSLSRLQNTLTYKMGSTMRTVGIAATDNYVYVTIKNNGNYKFEGFVQSLDEFKLIWERIL